MGRDAVSASKPHSELVATVRDGLIEHSAIYDRETPHCGECGVDINGDHRPGCHMPAAFAALGSLEEQKEADEREIKGLRALLSSSQTQLEAHERLYAACLAFQSDDHDSWKVVIHAMDGITAVSSPASRQDS